jgi:TrmH family RNA methyltransferase
MPTPETLRSRHNPLYRRLRSLKDRGGADLCLLEGPRLVREALEARVVLVEAAVSGRLLDTPVGERVLQALESAGVPVRRLAPDLMRSLSEVETSQGLLAVARRPRRDEEELYREPPLVLVAHAVQNPGNLGALLRTAEAAGATGAYVTRGSADPFSWKALRGSMGSAFRLPVVRGLEAHVVLDRLASRGVPALATAADGERPYDQADLRGPVALLVGGEGAGLPASLQERAAARLRIPLRPPVESLNVGVAAALVLFEAARQRGFRPTALAATGPS